MSRPVSNEDIFVAMAGAAVGHLDRRVAIPEGADVGEPTTHLALALNVLLEDLELQGREATRLAERLKATADSSRAFSVETGDVEQILRVLVTRIAEVVRGTCALHVVSEDLLEVRATYSHAADPRVAEHVARWAASGPRPLQDYPMMSEVLASGEPLLVPRVGHGEDPARGSPKWLEGARAADVRTTILLPLRMQGRVLGAIRVARHGESARPFDAEDVSFLQSLTDHAAPAIANARELVERQRLADRLRALAECARSFSAAPDLERLFDTVARQVAAAVKDMCAVLLLSDDGRRLLPAAIHGPADVVDEARAVFREPVLLADHAIARRVQETGEPVLLAHVDLAALRTEAAPRVADFARRVGAHSVLFVPLRFGDQSLGQITLARYRADAPPFDARDVELARGIADHAALAITNARAQSALRASEARYRLMFEASSAPKWLFDPETLRFLAVNVAAVRAYGFSREEFAQMTIKDLRPPEDVPKLLEHLARAGRPAMTHAIHRKKDGGLLTVEVTANPATLDGRSVRLIEVVDITERTRLEEQLRQSQKMDVVGRLAGGVAHDFNNVLSVIMSCAELALEDLEPGARARSDVEEILEAAQRAADLTRRLLGFSRHEPTNMQVLALDGVLSNMDRMLRRMIRVDVDLEFICAPSLGKVHADPASIEQVIVNLVVNARDAMPGGGKVSIEVQNVTLDDAHVAKNPGAKAGPFVMLAVADAGTGIEPAALPRLFEPFYTTKPAGKGTGLGLSTVFAIVQQAGGSIEVTSEIGKGSTFRVYLPRVDAAAQDSPSRLPPAALRGDETILLVEDDEQVRGATRAILTRAGYQVLEATDGADGLRICETHAGAIDVLLSDVVMPGLSGLELAERAALARPGMQIILMSGYTSDAALRDGAPGPCAAFLQKPVAREALTRAVREALDASRTASVD